MRDRIELRGVRALGVHGALPEERRRPQPFEVDVDVEADLEPAGRSDDLSDTVDYGALARTVERIVAGERFTLLERLAARIAEELCADDRVRAVTVAVRKLRPPVPVDMASAGVRITRGPRSRRRAFLGLGSNQGDRLGILEQALGRLPDLVAVSPLYETEPVGGPPGQPPYLNLVVELDTDLSPRQMLGLARRLEEGAGRVRGERHGPRTLDVDVLLVGDEVVADDDLVVPHPRMAERRFVMAPLADIAPDLVPPGWERSAVGAVRRVGNVGGYERHPRGPERRRTTE